MNVIIAVVFLNIAIVNVSAQNFDSDKLVKILKGRKSFDANSAERNEPVETVPLMPGSVMVKPDGISKTAFKYPKAKTKTIHGSLDHLEIKPDDNKADDLKSGSRNGNLMVKILKAVHNINNNRGRNIDYRYNKQEDQRADTNSKNERLLRKLLKVLKYKDMNENYKKERSRYDATRERSPNTGSKNGKLLDNIFKTVQNMNHGRGNMKRPSIILIETKPTDFLRSSKTTSIEDFLNNRQHLATIHSIEEEENDASEILDDEEYDAGDDIYIPSLRRNNKKKNKSGETRNRSAAYAMSTNEDKAGSGSSDYEKNPGNPFTIHKNKYKQNWLWNHYMDGDHMNINPFGPQFSSLGPSGPELFFGRKWWYFNQDDYKPMG